jgi:RNA polymerase sigma-70 factor (ECF subfamily)
MLLNGHIAEISLAALKTVPDEQSLVVAAQENPAGFADLYELHFERVYAFIVRRASSRDVAEDLTSEVFQQALANIKRFEWRGVPFAAWLMRIAANAIADRWRRQARERGKAAPDEAAMAKEPSHDTESRALLFRTVRALPEDQRRVIQMRFAEEKSVREIARALGRSEGAIRQLQFRALSKLRGELGGKPGERNG